jgi:hypothetical protein
MKRDPDIHIAMHSVLSLKPCVTRTNPLRPLLDHINPYKLTHEHQYVFDTYTKFVATHGHNCRMCVYVTKFL